MVGLYISVFLTLRMFHISAGDTSTRLKQHLDTARIDMTPMQLGMAVSRTTGTEAGCLSHLLWSGRLIADEVRTPLPMYIRYLRENGKSNTEHHHGYD